MSQFLIGWLLFYVLLCYGQSGVATREDTGEVQEDKFMILTGPRHLRHNIARHTGPQGDVLVCSAGRKQGWRGKAGARTFTGVSVGQAKKGRMNTLGVSSLNNFSGL